VARAPAATRSDNNPGSTAAWRDEWDVAEARCRFSELAGTEQGRQALEDIATNSKAKARREAAQSWLDYGRALEAAS